MAKITVLGGSGYAGGHIINEAVQRGHQVTSISRNLPEHQLPAVTYTAGDVLDPAVQDQAVAGADVVISALAPRGDMAGKVAGAIATLAEKAQGAGVRLGVIGGAGSLQVAPGGLKLLETSAFPDAFKAEAVEMDGVLVALRSSDETLDWFFLSPAAGFGAYAPGERVGEFRLGGDVLLSDAEGKSNLSGADLGVATVNEVETANHRRQRFTAAY